MTKEKGTDHYKFSFQREPSDKESAARLLFRIADGKIIKQYFQNLPRWSEILKESL